MPVFQKLKFSGILGGIRCTSGTDFWNILRGPKKVKNRFRDRIIWRRFSNIFHAFRRVENAVFVSFLNFEFKFRSSEFKTRDDSTKGPLDSSVRSAVCDLPPTEIEAEQMHGLLSKSMDTWSDDRRASSLSLIFFGAGNASSSVSVTM